MERLKSAYLLAFMALAAMPAAGQQTDAREPNTGTDAVVAVVGDVENCNTFPLPTGKILTVRQAVLDAGLVSDSVNVMVIRSTQNRPQWTLSVSATSADNGEPVENGDVLVVQSMSPLTAAVRKNAALRTDFGVTVVGLEQDGIVIGDVLQATNTLPLADGQLKVICRFSGQTPIAKAELYHPIVHGDVISISRSKPAVRHGFGSMTPTVSERKSGGKTVARDSLMSNARSSSHRALTSGQSMFPPSQLPATLEPSIFIPVQHGKSPEADAVSGSEEELPPVEFPALAINQDEDVANSGAADRKTSVAAGSIAVAPIAPSEIEMAAITNPTTTAFNPWNLVFMGGLLLAGTLILAGTLKPEPDDDSKPSNTASAFPKSDARHVRATPASHRKWTESPHSLSKLPLPKSITLPLSPTAEKLTTFEQANRTPSSARVAIGLVEGHEWFSGDWRGKINSGELSPHCTEAEGDSVPESCGTNHIPVPIVNSESELTTNEHSGAVSDVGSVKAELSEQRSFSDLEDLLQNRLPIDLCETQLPIRVTLFGKPIGPRRLRIDAGHAAIPAPHLTLSLDKHRDQTPATKHDAAADSSATHTPPVAKPSGSLDRALQFLQERTES